MHNSGNFQYTSLFTVYEPLLIWSSAYTKLRLYEATLIW
jgi:hypothetical protein